MLGERVGPPQQQRREFSVGARAEAAKLNPTREFLLREVLLPNRERVHAVTLGDKGQEHGFWVEKIDGKYQLNVSYVDVDAFVPVGSALDKDAYSQGFSQRTVSKSDPMLPPDTTSDHGLLRFRKNQPRPAITVTIPFDEDFNPHEPTIKRTVLTNLKAATPQEVDQVLTVSADQEDGELLLEPGGPRQFFSEYKHLATELARKRRENGDIEMYDLEHGFKTNERGYVTRLRPSEVHATDFMMREFQIAANISVTQHLVGEGFLPLLSRTQRANPHAAQGATHMQDVLATIQRPEVFQAELLKLRTSVQFDQAKYSSILDWHYGHNVGAYMQLEFPANSYQSVVAQRIVAAYADGEVPPYTSDDLASVADHLNTRSGEILKERHTFFDAQIKDARLKILTSPDPEALTRLTPAEFSTMIRLASRENALLPEVISEVERRLGENSLTPKDLLILLNQPPERLEGWQPAHDAVMGWLKENIPISSQVMNVAVQSLGWSIPEYHTDDRIVQNTHVFTATASTILPGQKEPIPSDARAGIGTKSKVAEQRATLDLLSRVFDIAIPGPWPLPFNAGADLQAGVVVPVVAGDMPAQVSVKREADPPSVFRDRLAELCERHGLTITYPIAAIKGSPSTLRASIDVRGMPFMSDEFGISEKTLDEAGELAAKQLLARLLGGGMSLSDRGRAPSPPSQIPRDQLPAVADAEKIQAPQSRSPEAPRPIPNAASRKLLTIHNGDYKSACITFVIRNKWEVKFNVIPTDDSRREAIVRIKVPRHGTFTYRAVGDDRTEASNVASQMILEELFTGEMKYE